VSGDAPPVAIAAASGAADIEAARALFRDYAAALPFDLEFQNFAAELTGLPAPYAPPGGVLLLAKSSGSPVGAVGVKRLADGVAEIKRLYVVPEARGHRLGHALLARAIGEAARIGYRRVRLDSHRASMGRAIALYRTLGFSEIAPYGPDLGGAIAFFEKRLDHPTAVASGRWAG